MTEGEFPQRTGLPGARPEELPITSTQFDARHIGPSDAEQIVEQVLLSAGHPPVPVGGPLKRLVLPSGRVRRPPVLAGGVVRRP